jgi:cytochrome c553
MYRNPLPLSDGQWIVAHASTTQQAGNAGSVTHPNPRYKFLLKKLVQSGSYWRAGSSLTGGIYKHVEYFDPNAHVSYDGPLWELWPCEVAARAVPPVPGPALDAPEQSVLDQKGVTLMQLQGYLRANDLALIVSRNVTRRDGNDRQQPYNLRVSGSATETVGGPGTVYDISHLQLFQADQVRGLTMGGAQPIPGRRVLAQPLHDGFAANPPNPGGPAGSVRLGSDGSMAALVPAKRALSWQLTDEAGEAVVRERYWVTFQPGEVRACAACHGLSSTDQAGDTLPTNPPEALGTLLQYLLDQGQL